MAVQSHGGITTHKQEQARKVTENLTPQHHPNLVKQLEELEVEIERLSNQLYVQSVCSFDVLYKTIQKATLYYAQKFPEELGEFYWVIDAKHEKVTPYEKLWKTIVLPALQSRSFKDPFIQLTEGDYSHFMKYCGEQPAPPKYLKDVVRKVTPFCFVDIRDIYQKHLTFSKSEDSLGLQLVDIAVTATRRVMNGNLQLRGWIGIARIMMESDRGGQVIQIIDLCGRQINYGHKKPPYWQVVPVAERARKELLLA